MSPITLDPQTKPQITKIVDTTSETNKKFSPNYRVLLHNDDGVYAGLVVESLQEVMGYSETRCVSIMMEAHQTGKGEVTVCCEEHAEHYSDSLNAKGLTTSIEPMEV